MKSLKFSGKLRRRSPFLIRKVVGDSMLPTLRPGRFILAIGYFNAIKVGDIVLVDHGGLEKVKRVGQIRDGYVYLIGDNSYASTDSRSFGWLHESTVVARVIFPRRRHLRLRL